MLRKTRIRRRKYKKCYYSAVKMKALKEAKKKKKTNGKQKNKTVKNKSRFLRFKNNYRAKQNRRWLKKIYSKNRFIIRKNKKKSLASIYFINSLSAQKVLFRANKKRGDKKAFKTKKELKIIDGVKRKKVKNSIKKLKILKYYLRYFKLYKKLTQKRRIFLSKFIMLFIYKLIRIVKKNLKKKLFVILLLLQKQWVSHNFNLLHYNKIFQKNIYVFFFYTKILFNTLKKTYWKNIIKKNTLVCKYYILNNTNFTANFLCNYILVKLGKMFTLNKILNPLFRHLKKSQELEGYRFVISGRLSRQERAAYDVKSYKAMPLSTVKTTIEYASDFKILKFGVVGLKIYLLYKSNHPYNSFYEFKITKR